MLHVFLIQLMNEPYIDLFISALVEKRVIYEKVIHNVDAIIIIFKAKRRVCLHIRYAYVGPFFLYSYFT